jgi:hypothetical protein
MAKWVYTYFIGVDNRKAVSKMTREKIIKTLRLNIRTANLFRKSGMANPEAKLRATGLVDGYKYSIELLKSK